MGRGWLAVFAAISVTLSLINATANDKCRQHCNCEDLEVSCREGKLPRGLGLGVSSFGKYFDPDLTKMHIDNSESLTSVLSEKTRLDPLTHAMLTYEDLVNLTLKGCFINTVRDDAFSDLVALKYLNLEDNFIETLSSKTFSGLRGLRTLSLKNNRLDQIPSGSLEPLISVVTLNLHGNRFATIQAGAFPEDALIESLDIGGNPNMEKIPNAVDSLWRLDKLYARDCRINALRDRWHDKFPGIVEVDLTNNAIPEITEKHFNGLMDLRRLYLGQNSLKRLGPFLFPGLIINHLNLSNNEIQNIDTYTFSAAQVTELDLSHNPVGQWHRRISQRIFNHSGIRWELRKLYLANVSLDRIDDLFKDIKRLNVLDLSGNRLETISSEELDDFAANLEVLLLAGNLLGNINGAFDKMLRLRRLSLADNSLRTFPLSLLNKSYRLQSLDFSDNLITHIPEALAGNFSRGNPQNVGLKGNPFRCDWQIKPLYDFMKLERQSRSCPTEIKQGKSIQYSLTYNHHIPSDVRNQRIREGKSPEYTFSYDPYTDCVYEKDEWLKGCVRPQCLRCRTPDDGWKFIIQLGKEDMKKPPKPLDDPLSTGGIVAILVTLIAVLVIIAIALILLKRRQEKRTQEEPADWNHRPDYDDDSFDESNSTFSMASKSVAHESNI